MKAKRSKTSNDDVIEIRHAPKSKPSQKKLSEPNVVKKKKKVLEPSKEKPKKKKGSISRAKAKLHKNKEEIARDEQILAELDSKTVNNDEKEYINEYLFVYRKLKRLVRKAEQNAMLTGKSQDYYAFCTLVSQQREVIADIRSISDLSGQVQMLIESAIQPLVSNMGQLLVNSFYQQKRLLIDSARPETTQFAIQKLDEITNEVTKALQMYYEQSAARVYEILVGAPEEPVKKKKRR